MVLFDSGRVFIIVAVDFWLPQIMVVLAVVSMLVDVAFAVQRMADTYLIKSYHKLVEQILK